MSCGLGKPSFVSACFSLLIIQGTALLRCGKLSGDKLPAQKRGQVSMWKVPFPLQARKK
jgi:hypothetical protein